MTHYPNPAPGNKPITVGHQYSVLTMLPDDRTLKDKHWVLPISAQRVPSDQKGHECGMQQLANTIDHLKLSDQMTISVGDTLYGTEKCRVSASKQNNLVHIFRLNSKRNVYSQPKDSNKRDKKKPGRHKEFGNKMNLNKPDTHLSIDDSTSTPWVSARGKQYQVAIDAWHNMLVRGSRSFKSSKHPITVIRIHITKENGESLYKKPLWLAVFGKKREQISLKEAYDTYRSRYDIEHFLALRVFAWNHDAIIPRQLILRDLNGESTQRREEPVFVGCLTVGLDLCCFHSCFQASALADLIRL